MFYRYIISCCIRSALSLASSFQTLCGSLWRPVTSTCVRFLVIFFIKQLVDAVNEHQLPLWVGWDTAGSDGAGGNQLFLLTRLMVIPGDQIHNL